MSNATQALIVVVWTESRFNVRASIADAQDCDRDAYPAIRDDGPAAVVRDAQADGKRPGNPF